MGGGIYSRVQNERLGNADTFAKNGKELHPKPTSWQLAKNHA
jgi:hypothetical protein